MAKRPTAPRPRTAPRPSAPTTSRRGGPPASSPEGSSSSSRPAASPRRAPSSRPSARPRPAAEAGSGAGRSSGAARPGSRAVGRPDARSEPSRSAGSAGSAAPHREEPGPGRVVQAADRFRALVAGRPWRRRRRAIIASVVGVLVLAGAALSAAIWLPALQLQQVSVSGLGYVEEEQVRSPLEARTGESVLLLPTGTLEEELAEVPGVSAAEVERRWPDGVHVSVTESVPLATLTRPDGSSAIVDGTGQELPAAAGEGATLVPLVVDPASGDPDGAGETMVEVLAELPDSLRGAVTEVTAASRSDVTLTLGLEDGGTKTVVWGDAQDSELKAEVVQALIDQPGREIDVSSPVAPVTR